MWVGYHASIGGSVTDFTLRRNADGMSAVGPKLTFLPPE